MSQHCWKFNELSLPVEDTHYVEYAEYAEYAEYEEYAENEE